MWTLESGSTGRRDEHNRQTRLVHLYRLTLMKTIAKGKRFHLWLSRYEYAWFELWTSWDYHGYTASVTLLTIELGLEWRWAKKREGIKRDGWNWLIAR